MFVLIYQIGAIIVMSALAIRISNIRNMCVGKMPATTQKDVAMVSEYNELRQEAVRIFDISEDTVRKSIFASAVIVSALVSLVWPPYVLYKLWKSL